MRGQRFWLESVQHHGEHPPRRAVSILYDITRVNPTPATAAGTAASDVFTVNLDWIGTTIYTTDFWLCFINPRACATEKLWPTLTKVSRSFSRHGKLLTWLPRPGTQPVPLGSQLAARRPATWVARYRGQRPALAAGC
jgi:hypothetical protein